MVSALVMVVAPTVTVTVLVSALSDLTVKLVTPLPLVVPEEAGVTVLAVPLTVHETFVPAPSGLLLASFNVTVTVEVLELSAARLAGLATTVELAALAGPAAGAEIVNLTDPGVLKSRVPVLEPIAVPVTMKDPDCEMVLPTLVIRT